MTGSENKSRVANSENRRQGRAKAGTRWLWLILILVAVAVIATALVSAARRTETVASDGGTFTVRRDNLTVTVTEGGSIRAHKSIQYKCQVERGRDIGEVSILSIVPAGSYITQEDVDNGMVLVELDSSALEDRLTQEEMELAGDQENAVAAQEAYEIQLIQNESDIAQGELRVRFALLDLQKYLGAGLAGRLIKDVNDVTNLTAHMAPLLREIENDPNVLTGSGAGQELKRLNDDIVLAEGNLATAQATLIGTEKLHDANYVSDLDLQRDRLNVENRKFAAEDAKVALNLFKSYDFPKNTEQYLSDYIEAHRQLERIHAQCRSRESEAKVRLSMAQEQLQRQSDRVKELKQQIAYCTIKAKAPGLVVYGTGAEADIFRAMRGRGGISSGVIAEGEVVTEGQVIISMPDTAAMIGEISVHETEVDKVRPGQPATIVMDAFPDRVLQGEVLEVAPLPDQQRGWMNPDLKVYQTLVSIDGTHDFLKSRMSCKVQILVRQLEDATIVPIQVVSNRGGRKVCYVASSQGAVERVVRTGVFNDTFVQIVDGLQPGEKVLLNPPLFAGSGGAVAFQQQQPLPERRTTATTTGAGAAGVATDARMDGQAGGTDEPAAGGPSIPGGFEITDEMRQKMQQFMRDGSGAGMPEGFQITDEMRQKMRQFMRDGGGAGMPEGFQITDEMRQKIEQAMRGGGRRGGQGGTEQADGSAGERTEQFRSGGGRRGARGGTEEPEGQTEQSSEQGRNQGGWRGGQGGTERTREAGEN